MTLHLESTKGLGTDVQILNYNFGYPYWPSNHVFVKGKPIAYLQWQRSNISLGCLPLDRFQQWCGMLDNNKMTRNARKHQIRSRSRFIVRLLSQRCILLAGYAFDPLIGEFIEVICDKITWRTAQVREIYQFRQI